MLNIGQLLQEAVSLFSLSDFSWNTIYYSTIWKNNLIILGTPPWFIRATHGKIWGRGRDGVVEIESVSGSIMRTEQELTDRKDGRSRISVVK